MFVRCLQLLAALALVAVVAGAPTQAFAHGAVAHVKAYVETADSKPGNSSQMAKSFLAEVKSYPDTASEDPSKENAYLLGYGACCGHGVHQMVAMLASPVHEPLAVASTISLLFDASLPPQSTRTLLEHPPKFFA